MHKIRVGDRNSRGNMALYRAISVGHLKVFSKSRKQIRQFHIGSLSERQKQQVVIRQTWSGQKMCETQQPRYVECISRIIPYLSYDQSNELAETKIQCRIKVQSIPYFQIVFGTFLQGNSLSAKKLSSSRDEVTKFKALFLSKHYLGETI